MPASIPGLIQGAVGAGARRDRFPHVRIKDLGGIVLESRAGLGEDAGEEDAPDGRGEHGWLSPCLAELAECSPRAPAQELCSLLFKFSLIYPQRLGIRSGVKLWIDSE